MKNVLLVDAGNSRLKWSILKKGKVSSSEAIVYGNDAPIDSLSSLIKTNKKDCEYVLLVSVQGEEFIKHARRIAKGEKVDLINITSQTKLGELKNAYENPQQLGADRFVAMLAGYYKAGDKACIIVDCGTAVTIDAIDNTGQHLGGLILPGLQVSSDSLLKGARQLELDPHQRDNIQLLANNTSQAILGGSFYGLSGAINEICSKIEKEITDLEGTCDIVKIICGGDAELLLPQLSSEFLIQADLVMEGLQLIAEHYLDYWDKNSKKSLQ